MPPANATAKPETNPTMNKPSLDFKAIFARAFELESIDVRARYLNDACAAMRWFGEQVDGLLKAFAAGGCAGRAMSSRH